MLKSAEIVYSFGLLASAISVGCHCSAIVCRAEIVKDDGILFSLSHFLNAAKAQVSFGYFGVCSLWLMTEELGAKVDTG
jgi:hypothetical protein